MKRFALMLLAAAALLGCRKDEDIIYCPQSTATLADIRAAAPAVQSFTLNLDQSQVVRTAGGATLTLLNYPCIMPDGSRPTGQAILRVREIYSVADMVLADMPTNGVGSYGPLVSAGELNIQVWQGSNRLQWNPSPRAALANPILAVPVPQAGLDTVPMRLWSLRVNDSTEQRSWWPAPLANATGQSYWPAIPPRNGFYSAALPLDSISWLNFDQYWAQYRTFTGVEVRVPAGASETRVFFRPMGYTSLARATPVAADLTRWQGQMPVGVTLQAIVLQVRDNQLYYGTQRYVPQSGAAVTPPLEALSAAEIVRRIRLL